MQLVGVLTTKTKPLWLFGEVNTCKNLRMNFIRKYERFIHPKRKKNCKHCFVLDIN